MILLTREARQMIELAVSTKPTLEVGGFGRAKVHDGLIVVSSIFIPPQEVGSAHTDIEGKDLRLALEALLRAGTTLSDWPFWWHSHCNMGVSPSVQDTDTLELLANELPNLGWFAGMVTNIKGEYHGWIEITKPVAVETKIEVLLEEDPVPKKLRERVKDMMEHVKPKPTALYKPTSGWQGQHSRMCVCVTCKTDDDELEAMMGFEQGIQGGHH